MDQKKDIYSIVTQQVLEGLEKGHIPWVKPWVVPPPCNLQTKKRYRGVNYLLLSLYQHTFA